MNYNINENLSELDLIIHSITKEEIVNQDIKSINSILINLRNNISKAKNKLMITFDGYDNDKREVYQIEEIRKYVNKVFNYNRDLFYYLTEINSNSKIILACMGIPKVITREGDISVKLGFDLNNELKKQIVEGLIIACQFDENKVTKIIKNLLNYEIWEN